MKCYLLSDDVVDGALALLDIQLAKDRPDLSYMLGMYAILEQLELLDLKDEKYFKLCFDKIVER